MLVRSALLTASLVLVTTVGCSRKEENLQTDTVKSSQAAPITITPAEEGPQYPQAKLTIVSPREKQVLAKEGDSVFVVMMVSGMDLAKPTVGDTARGLAYSHEGQHVHVIVDDKPYMANYRNGQPFNVGLLAPGVHYVRAFPSRSWHESVKTKGAFALRTFYVASDSAMGELSGDRPMLTYSRPKGSYKGEDAKRILLDFYLSNATLSPDGDQVEVSVDGQKVQNLTEWRPYYISGLQPGKHSIRLRLLDKEGNLISGRFNDAAQDIVVE